MGDDEAQVRAAAERLVAAFGSGRLDDYFACFADDATFVFYTTPQRLESVDAYRQLWDGWVREDGFRVTGCVSSAVRVQVLGDAAVMVHDVRTEVSTRAGAQTSLERETIVFARQEDGRGSRCMSTCRRHLTADQAHTAIPVQARRPGPVHRRRRQGESAER